MLCSHGHFKEDVQDIVNIGYFWGLKIKAEITMVLKFITRF